jgi:hypothetical protein
MQALPRCDRVVPRQGRSPCPAQKGTGERDTVPPGNASNVRSASRYHLYHLYHQGRG